MMYIELFSYLGQQLKENIHWVSLSLLLAAIPAIALLIYIYRADKNRPEPKGKVLKVFFFGLLFVIPVAFAEYLLTFAGTRWVPSGMWMHGYNAFAVAAGVEETSKFLVVMLVIFRHPVFDERMDGIVYTVAASLGFAFIENFLYIAPAGMFTSITEMLQIALLRGLLAVPGHAVNGVLTGYGLGRAKFETGLKRYRTMAVYLLAAIATHGVYDFIIFSSESASNPMLRWLAWLTVPLVAGMVFVSRKLIRHHVATDAKMMGISTRPPIDPSPKKNRPFVESLE